jgi:hypothetical protein
MSTLQNLLPMLQVVLIRLVKQLSWAPTLDNSQMLYKAYEYYLQHRQEILKSEDLSANRQAMKRLGVIRLLKLIS